MSNIHPDWQAEEGDQDVPVHEKEQPQVEPDAPIEEGNTVSRSPAAIVGMLAVLASGYVFFQGVESLTGQASVGGERTVEINADGLNPLVLEVEHGETIRWINNQEVPHIIESDTLCSDTGFCLRTNTLFEGDSDNFTITQDMASGTYDYFSSISGDINGQIVIVTTATDDYVDISSVLEDDFYDQFFGDETVNTTTPEPDSLFDTPDTAPDFQFAAAGDDNLPRNPYTVDSERLHPFDDSGNPVPEAFGDTPGEFPLPASQVPYNGNSGPLTQPETGAGVWLVVIASIITLCWITRNCFASVRPTL